MILAKTPVEIMIWEIREIRGHRQSTHQCCSILSVSSSSIKITKESITQEPALVNVKAEGELPPN